MHPYLWEYFIIFYYMDLALIFSIYIYINYRYNNNIFYILYTLNILEKCNRFSGDKTNKTF